MAKQYFQSSRNAWNLWNDDLKCFAPKGPDGNWAAPFDPVVCLPDSWNDPYFYEGTSIQWSFNVHHDIAGLIRRHGGNLAFVEHLDRFFEDGHYYSKETMIHIPWLYIYAGRPDKTAECVRKCMTKYFRQSRDGLSDNEDMGCQSAFYMSCALGLYPMMGQDIYLLTSPVFKHSEIMLGESGNILSIEALSAGDENIYVQSAMFNGHPLERAWLTHKEIAHGASLQFVLGSVQTTWGAEQLPPETMPE